MKVLKTDSAAYGVERVSRVVNTQSRVKNSSRRTNAIVAQSSSSKNDQYQEVQEDLNRAADRKRAESDAQNAKVSAENQNNANADYSQAGQTTEKSKDQLLSGNYNDYTVNSEHDLIIKVRERATGEQVRQIPSEEAVALKRAFSQMVEKIFDRKV